MTTDKQGNKYWEENLSIFHREDGPAIEFADGEKHWYVHGFWHRIDGPAIEYSDGSKCWFIDGKRHRIDGPACEYSDGRKQWWVNGEEYSYNQWKAKCSPFLITFINTSKSKTRPTIVIL